MKKLLIALVLIALPLFVTSCIPKDAVSIRSIEDVSISTGSGIRADIVLVVENSSGKNIKVCDAAFDLTDMGGFGMGRLIIDGDVTLPRRSTSEVSIPVRIKVANPLAALTLMKRLQSSSPQLLVTGGATLKAGGIKKKFKVENMPLMNFVDLLDGATEGFQLQQL